MFNLCNKGGWQDISSSSSQNTFFLQQLLVLPTRSIHKPRYRKHRWRQWYLLSAATWTLLRDGREGPSPPDTLGVPVRTYTHQEEKAQVSGGSHDQTGSVTPQHKMGLKGADVCPSTHWDIFSSDRAGQHGQTRRGYRKSAVERNDPQFIKSAAHFHIRSELFCWTSTLQLAEQPWTGLKGKG